MAVTDAALPAAPVFAPAALVQPRWKIWLAAVVIVLCGLAAYSNSFHGEFVFDDPPSIIENPSIQQGWWRALHPVMENGAPTAAGRPLVNLTLALNYSWGEFDVRGYHAVNLGIHLLAALALFGLLRRTLELPSMGLPDPHRPLAIAVLIALLWALHPLQTESVTYINQRAEALAGLFYLLTLYCFARSARTPRRWPWLAAAVGACVLGMASKEVMVTAPVMVWLYDRTFISGTFREALRRHIRLYVLLAATWVILGYLIIGANFRANSVGFHAGMAWWTYALKQCEAVVLYLRLAFWPSPLILDYGADVVKIPAQVWPQIVLLTMLLGGTLYALWRRPKLGFLGAWFFVALAPTSSIVPLTMETIAERRMYLPLAAVLAAVVMAVLSLAGRRGLPVCALLVGAFGCLTYERNADYLTAERILRDTVAKAPASFRAQQNLGVELARAGRAPEAVESFAAVLRTAPEDANTHNNLGNALLLLNRVHDALPHYQKAVALNPRLVEARNNLGLLLVRLGQVRAAADEFRAVLQLKPDSREGQINLANAYNFSDRPALGLSIYEALVQQDASSAPAQYGLGNSLFLLGRYADAARAYAIAAKLQPNAPEYHASLGNALLFLSRYDDAASSFQEALRHDPGSANARMGLEAALARRRQNANPVTSP